MTSSSGRDGHCNWCGCANDNHIFERCTGFNKKGKKNYEPCQEYWIRCTTAGHGRHKYVDCYRCPSHPAAPPSSFWGAEPLQDDDESGIYVPMIQEIQLMENAPPGGHERTTSEDSIDPLQWDTERYNRETSEVAQITERLDQVQVAESVEDLVYVDAYLDEPSQNVWFESSGQHFETNRVEWSTSKVMFMREIVDCFRLMTSSSIFYTWEFKSPSQEPQKEKGKQKGKDKGRSKDKDKGRGKEKDAGKGKGKSKERK